MALLASYSDANKVTLRAETVVKLRTLVFINGYGNAWQVETITRESYEYVGMDETTALACQAALIGTYTVMRNIATLDAGEISYSPQEVQIADVSASPMGGRMWKVSVDVNDRVITFAALTPAS